MAMHLVSFNRYEKPMSSILFIKYLSINSPSLSSLQVILPVILSDDVAGHLLPMVQSSECSSHCEGICMEPLPEVWTVSRAAECVCRPGQTGNSCEVMPPSPSVHGYLTKLVRALLVALLQYLGRRLLIAAGWVDLSNRPSCIRGNTRRGDIRSWK